MTSGGARPRAGRQPDPLALRRDRPDDKEWTTLPAFRAGPAPSWPLSEATKRELVLWKRQWTRPQAAMWELAGQEEAVALYVRVLAVAEMPTARVDARNLAKQLMDSLGISLVGMRSLRWTLGESPLEQAEAKPAGPSARDRLRLVIGAE